MAKEKVHFGFLVVEDIDRPVPLKGYGVSMPNQGEV